ncbi:hypothetical protein M3J09_003489 [Ascochyta lentis]
MSGKMKHRFSQKKEPIAMRCTTGINYGVYGVC